ncbi:hypothetical protein PTQ19_05080 [Microbacterium esteraromaticum]|uniref:hypothetical protein n=1 Tax=Microbacterium esteraromaticum TaxID=57043 RepID=UPI00236782C3|nr:hypothetical protein [Microbacterium esteraromaticum]WDH79815.1 hypothetical protein PTQ19_05080 [Microbacterium esteraromaticum]
MRIVVFAPSAGDIAGGLKSLAAHAEVTVVSTMPAQWPDADSLAVGTSPLRLRLSEFARRTPPGRALRRLTPLDPGAMFAHRARRSAQAQAAISAADLLVSVERDAHYAVWREARRRRRQGAPVPAVVGFPAARVTAGRFSRDS